MPHKVGGEGTEQAVTPVGTHARSQGGHRDLSATTIRPSASSSKGERGIAASGSICGYRSATRDCGSTSGTSRALAPPSRPRDQPPADKPGTALQHARDQPGKLGNTPFVARQIELFTRLLFIAASQPTACAGGSPPWRRLRLAAYRRPERRIPHESAVYPQHRLSYRQRAEQRGGAVLREHGGEHAPRMRRTRRSGSGADDNLALIRYSQQFPRRCLVSAEPLELKMGKESFRLRRLATAARCR